MIEQSIIHFKKVAADENHEKRSDAMFNIALIYDNGFGIQTDKTRALYYYESASELIKQICFIQFRLDVL